MGKYIPRGSNGCVEPESLGMGTPDETTVLYGDKRWRTPPAGGGSDPNTPTASEKAALQGTTGAPSGANRYVTNSDARMTDARTPLAHSHTYEPLGTVATHESDTTSVHGIANTANLVLTSDARLSDARTPLAHSHAQGDVTGLTAALSGKEAALGNPATNGHVLSSTTGGARSWVALPAGGGAAANGRLVANATTTLIAAANLAGLSFAIGANEVWSFEVYLRLGCSGTGGVKLAVDIPAGATIQAFAEGTTNGPTAFTGAIITTDAALTAVAFNNVAGQNGRASLTGCVANGATPGTVQIQFASTTAGQTSTAYANSYLVARKVS